MIQCWPANDSMLAWQIQYLFCFRVSTYILHNTRWGGRMPTIHFLTHPTVETLFMLLLIWDGWKMHHGSKIWNAFELMVTCLPPILVGVCYFFIVRTRICTLNHPWFWGKMNIPPLHLLWCIWMICWWSGIEVELKPQVRLHTWLNLYVRGATLPQDAVTNWHERKGIPQPKPTIIGKMGKVPLKWGPLNNQPPKKNTWNHVGIYWAPFFKGTFPISQIIMSTFKIDHEIYPQHSKDVEAHDLEDERTYNVPKKAKQRDCHPSKKIGLGDDWSFFFFGAKFNKDTIFRTFFCCSSFLRRGVTRYSPNILLNSRGL